MGRRVRTGALALLTGAALLGSPAVAAAAPSSAPTSGSPSSAPSSAPTSGSPSSAPSSAPTSGSPSSGSSSSSSSSSSPSPSPSPSPSGSQLTNPVVSPLRRQLGIEMQQAKDAADRRVATVQLSLRQQADRVARRTAAASATEQRYTEQLALQRRAESALGSAGRRLTAARAEYKYAYSAFAAAAVSAYESDTAPGSLGSNVVGSLLVVDDPSGVLNLTAEHQMVADHQANALGRVKLALTRIAAAKKQQAAALAVADKQTNQLALLRVDAGVKLQRAQQALNQLRHRLSTAKQTQAQADRALTSFLGGWSSADPATASALNQRYEKIARQMRNDPPAPADPTWTAAMGRTVVARAVQTIGTPYAWAGGSSSGPTRGQCVSGPARNDCHLIGFDCSGLALFSWAPYTALPHNAEAQYRSGSVHPSPAELKLGDLVFWSSNSAVSGIHHVAIYVGDGDVLQAPQSGDIVRITPLRDVSRGYFGATRPLS